MNCLHLLRIVGSLACLTACVFFPSASYAARQKAVLIPIPVSGDNTTALGGGALDRAIAEKLSDRFDIRILSTDSASDAEANLKKAQGAGTPYLFEGSLVRIGRSVSIELRVASTEPGSFGKTVVATLQDDSLGAAPQAEGLPPIYRRLITESTANLKLRFFGDDRAGGGGKISGLTGRLSRSGTFSGNPVSAMLGEPDGKGKRDLIVTFPTESAIFRIEGDDLFEKRRIPGPALGKIADKGGMIQLSAGKERPRFAAIGEDGIPVLYDREKKRLGAATEPVRGIESNTPQPRLLAVDLNADGVDELLAVRNLMTPGVFFENVRVQSGAEILAFAQEGGALRLAWRTPQTGFGVVDAFLLDSDAKDTRRIGLLVREKGKLLEGQSEWRIAWMR